MYFISFTVLFWRVEYKQTKTDKSKLFKRLQTKHDTSMSDFE